MCRMLLAAGKIDVNAVVDAALKMGTDQNRVHELNKEQGLGSWTHGDGWGIAYVNEQGEWTITKSTEAIYNDELLNEIRNIKTNLLILHMRKKIGSDKAYENTHPFSVEHKKKGTFVFCHNGFIDEEITFDAKYKAKGQTDSEKLFYSILSDLKRTNIEAAIRRNFKRYKKLTGTNIILSTKKRSIIAIRKNKFPTYYQMGIGRTDEMTLVSSEEVDTVKGMSWEALEQGDIVSINHETKKITVGKEERQLPVKLKMYLGRIKRKVFRKATPIYRQLKQGVLNGN